MLQGVPDRGTFGIEILNRLLLHSVPLFELFDLSSHREDLTCQLDGFGVGATAAAAIHGRRSSRGGSRPGLGSLACGLVESQWGFESFYFCRTTHRARAEEAASQYAPTGVWARGRQMARGGLPFLGGYTQAMKFALYLCGELQQGTANQIYARGYSFHK